ncbi:hypothetical protein ACN4GA_19045 [Raoultella terrigena]|uniref:Uncharacterized protein n=1 Tax=Raoultella terrigena TaxID=577 RepID=A0AAP9XNB9_RAOTE|nr:hypothetical protein [Raoultella terrigena]MCE9899102.1 hypothetical protein [Raoultella terrigena]MEB7601502.1 hypothetical protein [Raoultella terrigena]QPF07846.1 hypothetical protein IMO34_21370 [Raoultella terrigena]
MHTALLTSRGDAFITLCYDTSPSAPHTTAWCWGLKPRIRLLTNSIMVMHFAYYGNTTAIPFYYLLLKMVIELSLVVIYGGCFCCLFFNRENVSLIIRDNPQTFLENKSGIRRRIYDIKNKLLTSPKG